MSHRWNCPSDYEARSRARRDADFDLGYGIGRDDYRQPYDCDDGNRAYRRAYQGEADRIEEDRAMERRIQRRREEERQEQKYHERQWAEEEEQRQAEAAYYEELEAAHWWSVEWAPRWLP